MTTTQRNQTFLIKKKTRASTTTIITPAKEKQQHKIEIEIISRKKSNFKCKSFGFEIAVINSKHPNNILIINRNDTRPARKFVEVKRVVKR